MIIYESLKKDHEKVTELLRSLVETVQTDHKERGALLRQIRDELIPHARAEEAIFYNSLREIDAAKELVAEAYWEHLEAEGLLRSLQTMDAVDLNWRRGAEKLKEITERHIIDEETATFDVAKTYFLDQEAEMMGEAFEKLKVQIREGGLLKNMVDLIANMMPERFRGGLRKFTQDIPETPYKASG